jgi:UDP-glucose 4-epimerase
MYGVPTAALRFFNVFGSRQDPRSPYSGVISIFADRIARGEKLIVHGDGQQTRDFVTVADTVRFLLAAMTTLHKEPRSLLCNVCSGRAMTIEHLAREMTAAAGRGDVEIAGGPARPGDIRHSLGDPTQAEAELNLRAETAFREGLAGLIGSLHTGCL